MIDLEPSRYPDYDEENDSTYEYESDEDEEPLDYSSDVSDDESDYQEVWDIPQNSLEKVVPFELRQGRKDSKAKEENTILPNSVPVEISESECDLAFIF